MALTKFKFDTHEVPFVKQESFSFSNDQTENKTEGGRTVIQKIRSDIFSMKFSTTCLSDMAHFYHEYSLKDSFVLSYYDTYTQATRQRTVHMENYSEKLLENSHDLAATNGIYSVSFTLEEF